MPECPFPACAGTQTASRPLPVRLGWDRARQSKDFLAVIDADPSSPNHSFRQQRRISPEEPRTGPDGSVFVQTRARGPERITGITSDHPTSQLVYTFPGDWCGVPAIVGHFLIETASFAHAAIVLDIANGAKPVEGSRVKFDDNYYPHWCTWDAVTNRIVITPGGSGHSRLYLLKFNPQTCALAMDDNFVTATVVPASTLKIDNGRTVGKGQPRLTEPCSHGSSSLPSLPAG